jgi:hypothetical protein
LVQDSAGRVWLLRLRDRPLHLWHRRPGDDVGLPATYPEIEVDCEPRSDQPFIRSEDWARHGPLTLSGVGLTMASCNA